MSFWQLAHDARTVAAIDERGTAVSYGELAQRAGDVATALRPAGGRRLGFIAMRNTLPALAHYLGCLRAGHVPLLLAPELPAPLLQALVERYDPAWIFDASGGLRWRDTDGPPLHADLALLLTTSGTTGSPRLVRLSHSALHANAESIARFLGIGAGERAVTTLPLHYSYGLSVLHSHLHAGASVVLTDASIIQRPFWETVDAHGVTSLSGVPYLYQLLQRTGFEQRALPSLRTLTQAGGPLGESLTRHFQSLAAARSWRFFVMYGQTEATARISYVPPEHLARKVGAIGIPVPGGALALDGGELVYRGPNVMMGYAETAADLAMGDVLRGVLRTGDRGRMDEDGFFYVTGRLGRFVKLAGHRVGLDEVEAILARALGVAVAVTGRDDRLLAAIEAPDASAAKDVLVQQLRLHPSMFQVTALQALPRLPNGKPDYAALQQQAGAA
ncbi:AMP-binding protein [Caenimonas sedimenti]|uniref:AMP-binding protein n=1 Tax=Caenimonas sedimenti TaxID=2596921 RepID=A0A562ZH32_9BURK|nr:AMP-binding protein [Caenimonas sedimenti]TWO67899.1 AMP-binding protein [Caenimonas sedimenti]